MVGFKLQDIQRRILYSKLEFYAEDENNFNCYVSTWNFNIMFKFKLQDIQRDEHYIPNWNFMPRNETVKLQDYYVQVQVTKYST